MTSGKSPLNVENELNTAIQYHQSGQLDKAEEIYKNILKVHPDHADALHLLGVIASQTGKQDVAIDLITNVSPPC